MNFNRIRYSILRGVSLVYLVRPLPQDRQDLVARRRLCNIAILAFLLTWGEFLFALLLSESPSSYTSTVVVSLFATDVDVSFVSIITAGVLSVIPPIGFALIFQRYIISGLLSGSLKG